jgi:hypothetical protein
VRFKYINHKNYSAPLTARRKVDGKWTYTKLAQRVRDFSQRVLKRMGSMSIASRYAPHASEAHKTYVDHDQLVTQLILEGEPNPSTMAKRKFFPHRPKAQNNVKKNRARRAARQSWQIANEACRGNKPEPALIMNSAQARIQAGKDNVRAHRRITADQWTGRRNYGWSINQPNGDRECARRRRQMGLA